MAIKELAQRISDGVEVSLVWSDDDGRLCVRVNDTKTGEEFEVDAARDKALDVYYHPFAYAPLRAAA